MYELPRFIALWFAHDVQKRHAVLVDKLLAIAEHPSLVLVHHGTDGLALPFDLNRRVAAKATYVDLHLARYAEIELFCEIHIIFFRVISRPQYLIGFAKCQQTC